MRHREHGDVGAVTEIGLGTWNIGSDWGDVSDEAGREAIRELAVNAVSTVIAGPASPAHIGSNVAAADLGPVSPAPRRRSRRIRGVHGEARPRSLVN